MKLYSKIQQAHFCLDRGNKSQVFRFEIKMNAPLDDGLLLDAVKKTLRLFPTAASRPVITSDKKRVGMIPNPAEPVIYHEDIPAALGTDESNGYLFRVISMGERLIVSIYHAMCDGRAGLSFVTHILWFYLTSTGCTIDPEGLLYTQSDLSDPDVTATMEERLTEYGITAGYTDPRASSREMLFHDTREDELYDSDKFCVVRHKLPFSQLRSCTKELGVTPLLLFYVLAAQSMRETAAVGDKVIQCCYAADIRARLHSCSQEEFSSMGNLYYTPGMASMPLEEQLHIARSELDEMMSGDNILRAARSIADDYDGIAPYMDLTMTEQLRPLFSAKTKENSSGIFMTNVGLLRLPKDMQPYVESILICGVPAKYDPNIDMQTYKDTFYFNFIHNSTDHSLVWRLAEKLRALGVDCECDHTATMRMDYLGRLSMEGET